MKNIHLIETDKPSRLHITGSLNLYPNGVLRKPQGLCKNQHIYITSDEEIKDGDWMIRGNEQPTLVTPNFFWDFGVRYYKIILTTDQDLIEDGVQDIDDEFLEWFVNNPSCEFIQTKRLEDGQYFDYLEDNSVIEGIYENYKIIIPQEEPKQDSNFYKKLKFSFSEKLKQYFEETPREKILEDWAKSAEFDNVGPTVDDFLNNTKKMYSEEEMINFAEFVATYSDKNRNVNGEMLHAKSKYDGAERTIDLLEKWFEQFKNK